jgi:hypothetical protein
MTTFNEEFNWIMLYDQLLHILSKYSPVQCIAIKGAPKEKCTTVLENPPISP